MKRLCIAALLGLALVLSGCGGGGSPDNNGSAERSATLVFRVQWPVPAPSVSGRLVPAASNSIRVIVTDGSDYASSAVLKLGESRAEFTNAPVGGLTVTATAHPNPDGTGIPQATRSIAFTSVAGDGNEVDIEMLSTVASLQVEGSSSVSPGQVVTLTPSAWDAPGGRGNKVVTDPAHITWTSQDPSIASVPARGDPQNGAVVVTGVALGQTVITVEDTESGVRLSFPFTVRNDLGEAVLSLSNVPSAARKIRVEITAGATQVALQTFDAGVSTIRIPNLPPSGTTSYTVVVTAFPQEDASGVAQARSEPRTLSIPGVSAVSLATTIDRIVITPAASTVYLAQGRESATLVVTALDNRNQAVVFNPALLTWGIPAGRPTDVIQLSTAPPNPSPAAQATLQITGVKGGTTQVEATYTEFGSGLTTMSPAAITVSAGTGSVIIPVN